MDNKKNFAKNLIHYMNLSGKTQKEIAEFIGVSPSSFNDWIKAKKYPRIDKIEKLATYFGISKSDLIEENDFEEKSLQETIVEKDEISLIKTYRTLPETEKEKVIKYTNLLSKTYYMEAELLSTHENTNQQFSQPKRN